MKALLTTIILLSSLVAGAQSIGTLESMQPGVSGLFFNPDQDGQGVHIEYLENFNEGLDTLVMTVYTYSEIDNAPTWLVCQGNIETKGVNSINKNAVKLNCYYTERGEFLDGGSSASVFWGNAVIEAHSCDRLKIKYTSNQEGVNFSPAPEPSEVGILRDNYEQDVVRLTPAQRMCVEQCSSPDFAPSRCQLDDVD